MKRPFMLLYINDFLSDETVMLMDEFQFTWYMKMLMRAWKNEPACKLESDDESLMLAAGCTDKTVWDQKKGLILRNWKLVDRGKYVTNGRLQEEFNKMCAISDKRSIAAKAKQTPAKAHQVTATQTHTQTHIEKEPKPIASSPVDSPLIVELPLNDNSAFEVRQVLVEEMAQLYPAVAIVQEFRNMRGWLLANQQKRKTKSGILRFVNNWLAKAQNSGGSAGSNHGSKQEERVIKSREAISRVLSPLVGRDRPVPQDGSERCDDKSLVRGPQRVLGSGDP